MHNVRNFGAVKLCGGGEKTGAFLCGEILAFSAQPRAIPALYKSGIGSFQPWGGGNQAVLYADVVGKEEHS